MDAKRRYAANQQAIYQLYLCLAHKTSPQDGETLSHIVGGLRQAADSGRTHDRHGLFARWRKGDKARLALLEAAVSHHARAALSRIGDQQFSEEGQGLCTFTDPLGELSVVYRGTGGGEWIDNGEGLSGDEQTNVYEQHHGGVVTRTTVVNDHAAAQQVQALNEFRRIMARHGADAVTVSGYSKGGNKAQFVTLHDDRVKTCFSFCGQGFSPEAVASFAARYGGEFERRCQKIISIAGHNDFVGVLGIPITPTDNRYWIDTQRQTLSPASYHLLEAMLCDDGLLGARGEQGALSTLIERVSDRLMALPPAKRSPAVRGAMNVLAQVKGVPVNGDSVSWRDTVSGLATVFRVVLEELLGL